MKPQGEWPALVSEAEASVRERGPQAQSPGRVGGSLPAAASRVDGVLTSIGASCSLWCLLGADL